MIDLRLRVLTIVGSAVVLLLVLELVRRRKLKEEYSVVWVVTAVALLVLSVWTGLLEAITDALGISAPASLIFFFGLLFFLVLMLHFSVKVSALERKLTALSQEVAIRGVEGPVEAARLEEFPGNSPSRPGTTGS